MLLHGDNGLVKQSSSQVRIVAEALPIATSANDSPEPTAYRSESHVGALALELCSKVFLRLVNELFVPGGTEMEARWVAVDAICVANAITIVYQAKTRETKSRNAA